MRTRQRESPDSKWIARSSSESCSEYENPSEATPYRFESGPGHHDLVFRRLISSCHVPRNAVKHSVSCVHPGFLREADAGLPVKELCRKHGFSEASYYLWRSKFGGMEVSDAKVLRYAIATGRANRDVSVDLRGALAPIVTKNHAAITEPARIGELLRSIDGYVGQPVS